MHVRCVRFDKQVFNFISGNGHSGMVKDMNKQIKAIYHPNPPKPNHDPIGDLEKSLDDAIQRIKDLEDYVDQLKKEDLCQ